MSTSKNVNNDVTMNPATHLRQHIKLVVCVFVVLIAFEGEKCIKAIIVYQLFQGYSFKVTRFSAVTPFLYVCLFDF